MIKLPLSTLVTIELGPPDPDKPGEFRGGSISGLSEGTEDNPELHIAFRAIESLLLAHACAGVDVTAANYIAGIEVALEAIVNSLD